jgi:two-component system, LytTR family, sensor kinase
MNRFWKYKADHVIFWIITIAFHIFTRVGLINTAGAEQFILEIIIRNALLAGLIYFNWLVIVPKFARQGKVLPYVISLSATLMLYVLLKNAHDVYLNGYVIGDVSKTPFFYHSFYNFSIALFYLAFYVALQLSKEWYFQREVIRQMELDKVTSELEYLKAQINPHFVFNSINTIYFQIDKENVAARESLSAFSEMLRYQLYECNGTEIPIEKEILYLKNYIALQRMRKDEKYTITFSVGEQVKGFTISPLLIIPFVENAFKYVSHHPDKNEIRIQLDKQENQLMLSVFNTKETKTSVNGHSGIGLKNVQRRLELVYKDRHNLAIDNRADAFEVNLSLQVE